MFEVVINPNGASGESMKVWQQVEPVFKASGKEYRVHISNEDDDISGIVKQLSQNPCDIVIVGGDGSLNHAVNGIADFENVRIGMISVGSGNDFMRSIGVKRNPVENAKTILAGENVREVNLGEVTYYNRFEETMPEKKGKDGYVHHRFIISSGVGFDAQVCHESERSACKTLLNRLHLGKLIYLITAVRIILHARRTKAWISVDGKEKTVNELLLAVVMNEPYEGGGFKFCPHADDSDDILDVVLADGISNASFCYLLPLALKGKHEGKKGVHPFKGRKIEIRTEEPFWVHTDGETVCRSSHVVMTLHEKKVRILI